MTLVKKYQLPLIIIYVYIISAVKFFVDESIVNNLTHMSMVLIMLVSLFFSIGYIIQNQNKLKFSKIFFALSIFFYLLEVISVGINTQVYREVIYVEVDFMLHFIRNIMLACGVFFTLMDYVESWNKLRLIIDIFVFGFFVIYIAWFGFINIYISSTKYDEFQNIFAILYIATDAMLVFFYILLYTHEKNYFKRSSKKMEVIAFIYILFSDLVYFYALVKDIYYPSVFFKLMPLAFLLIAFSLEDEYTEEIEQEEKMEKEEKEEDLANQEDKYMLIILIGMGIVSFAINPDILKALLFSVMIAFRIISEEYTLNYEISEYLVSECVQKNKDLKEKALYLAKISSDLENRIIQRTKELENINRDLIEFSSVDMATKLHNRSSFIRQLDKIIEEDVSGFAVVFIDIDRFKTINEWYGHDAGDYILLQIARRIKKNIGEKDITSRLGGDEFGIIISGFEDLIELTDILNSILSDIRKPFITKERKIFITASIGASLYPEHSKNRSMLMKYADISMYKSKADGKDRYTLYDLIMKKEEQRRLEIENILYESLAKNEFVVVYRPQFEINSSKIKAIEAFVRWDSSVIGNIKESEFLSIAEENGLVIELDKLILEESLKRIKYINEKYDTDMAVAVNISPRHFMEPKFVIRLEEKIKKYKLNPRWLEIEVTEELIMGNEEIIISRLNQISQTGVRVVLDKFGRGYSSFIYLKKLPIDKIKIDPSFIQNIEFEENYKIVKAITLMCNYMGITSSTEGVTTNDQIKILREIECDLAQGEYYGESLTFEEIEKQYF